RPSTHSLDWHVRGGEALQGAEPVVSQHRHRGRHRRIRRGRKGDVVAARRFSRRVSARGAAGDAEGPPLWGSGRVAAQVHAAPMSVAAPLVSRAYDCAVSGDVCTAGAGANIIPPAPAIARNPIPVINIIPPALGEVAYH